MQNDDKPPRTDGKWDSQPTPQGPKAPGPNNLHGIPPEDPRHDEMPRHDDPTELEPRPSPPPLSGSGSTMPQLKMDIDSGVTGDKLAVLDVGLVPLGTDDEAAGFPPTPELVHAVRQAERMAAPPPGDPGKRPGVGKGSVILVLILAAVALALGAAFIG